MSDEDFIELCIDEDDDVVVMPILAPKAAVQPAPKDAGKKVAVNTTASEQQPVAAVGKGKTPLASTAVPNFSVTGGRNAIRPSTMSLSTLAGRPGVAPTPRTTAATSTVSSPYTPYGLSSTDGGKVDSSAASSLFAKRSIGDRLNAFDETSQLSAASSSSAASYSATTAPHGEEDDEGVSGSVLASSFMRRVSFSSTAVTSGFLQKLRADDVRFEVQTAAVEKEELQRKAIRKKIVFASADGTTAVPTSATKSEGAGKSANSRNNKTAAQHQNKPSVAAIHFAASLDQLPGRHQSISLSTSSEKKEGSRTTKKAVSAPSTNTKNKKQATSATAAPIAAGIRVPAFMIGQRTTHIPATTKGDDGGVLVVTSSGSASKAGKVAAGRKREREVVEGNNVKTEGAEERSSSSTAKSVPIIESYTPMVGVVKGAKKSQPQSREEFAIFSDDF